MGCNILLMGTLCAVVLQLTPADMWQSESELVHGRGSAEMVDQDNGSVAMPAKNEAVVLGEIVRVEPQLRGSVVFVAQAEGNIRDGYTLHEPAPT